MAKYNIIYDIILHSFFFTFIISIYKMTPYNDLIDLITNNETKSYRA